MINIDFPLIKGLYLGENNAIIPITVDGTPLYIYLYAFIFLTAVIFGVYGIMTKRHFNQAVSKTVFAAMFCVFIISDSFIFRYQLARYLDYEYCSKKTCDSMFGYLFFGDQARAFIDICRKNIPAKSRIKLYVNQDPFKDYRVVQAGYFLYPLKARLDIPDDEADYVIGYYTFPDLGPRAQEKFQIVFEIKDIGVVLQRTGE